MRKLKEICRAIIRTCWVLILLAKKHFTRIEKLPPLEIHFFSLVLNGMPFVTHHINVFQNLKLSWKWHIIEGVAELKHDTAWSVHDGGRIPDDFQKDGLSIDGTTQYLDELARQYPENIVIHRKANGAFWDGKVEMCNAPIKQLKQTCLLWQLDVDELWTQEQIEKMAELFRCHPEKTSAWFYCRYFVGPTLEIISRNMYANNPQYEWLRVWRYRPGMKWQAHEPPTLMLKTWLGSQNPGTLLPFTHANTEKHDLVFEHYAYVLPSQLRFKESYYGYSRALEAWKRLQECKQFPVRLASFFPWVKDETLVDRSTQKRLLDQQTREPMA
jgi:hypothetical protein